MKIKKLHWYIFKSFIGPFLITFIIVMFILLMQFLWRYIDELAGKGLKISIILELLLYASASLVPLALPLSVLMSSLMTMGNLGENNEITALKSSGISLRKIITPLFVISTLIAITSFVFANNVLPIANFKMRVLINDIRKQRPEIQIKEGEFFNGIDNYSIRINRKNPHNNILYDILIYDHTQGRGNTTVIKADSGIMKLTSDNKNFLITLWGGISYNEMPEDRRKLNKTFPHRIDKFKEQTIIIKLEGFDFERTDESFFKKNFQMMSLRQLKVSIDSLNRDLISQENYFFKQVLNDYIYKYRRNLKDSSNSNCKINIDSIFNSLPDYQRINIYEQAISQARSSIYFTENNVENISYLRRYLRRHEIEWHRKFTLSLACIVFLFIGAPLGAIIRKGGLGMPAVISLIFFILYYVISLLFEKMVRESVIPSFYGMWFSTFIVTTAGIFITIKATSDSSLFNVDVYLNLISKIFGLKKNLMIEKNIHIASKFDYSDISKDELINSLKELNSEIKNCIENIKNEYINAKPLKILLGNNKLENNKFDNIYNKVFKDIVTSKWSRISYISNSINELEYINFNNKLYNTTKTIRTLLLFLLPIGLLYVLILKFSMKKLIKKLENLHTIINNIISALNSNIFLAEVE